ncbi:hypothetical protein ABH947_004194 [Bacillus sp. RC206]
MRGSFFVYNKVKKQINYVKYKLLNGIYMLQ